VPCPWIFTHNTNIVDKGFIVLFSGIFLLFSVFFPLVPPWKRLNSALFLSILLFFGLFSLVFPGNFSAETLVCNMGQLNTNLLFKIKTW